MRAILQAAAKTVPVQVIAINADVSYLKLWRFIKGVQGTKITLQEGLRLTQYFQRRARLDYGKE